MKKYFLFIAVLLLLVSCSPQKRLHRLVSKHPELTRIDTIKIQDSVFVPETNVDTVFLSSLLHDTVTITQEKLQIKLIEKNDTIYLNANVKPDTIIITKEIPVQKIVHIEPEKWWVKWWWVVLLVGIVGLLLIFRG